MAKITQVFGVKRESLNPSPEQLADLEQYITDTIEDALSARRNWDRQMKENLRLYEAIPSNPVKNFPVDNAPNIEIPLGAIAADSVIAMASDLIRNSNPLLTVRPRVKDAPEEAVEEAKVLQEFANWVGEKEAHIHTAGNDAINDDVILGTGWMYIPWVERVKHTKSARILSRGPVIRSVPPEDVIVYNSPTGDHQDAKLFALRFYRTKGEVSDLAKKNKWFSVDEMQPTSTIEDIRFTREALARQYESPIKFKNETYEVLDVYCYYDIDNDGFDEDLYCVYDRSSRKIVKVTYNPFDCRPAEKMTYNHRAHMTNGQGVIEMLAPFQRELSDFHNNINLNMLLANARVWYASDRTIPESMTIWPGKVIHGSEEKGLVPLQMADVYQSAFMVQQLIISLSERRVGVNEMSMPRQSAVMGSRTPGMTTMSLLQQANRRFSPAFASIRECYANAIIQCLIRYQERLLRGDQRTEEHIRNVMGEQKGSIVISVLKNQKFDEQINIELTASSVTANAEADKQNAMLLVQILTAYYQRTIEIVTIASNPQVPEPVRNVALQISKAAGEVIDRTIRKFDQIRDPETFVIDLDNAVNQVEGGQDEMMQLQNLINAGMGGAQGGVNPAISEGMF